MPFKNDSMETEIKNIITRQNYMKFHNLKKTNCETWGGGGIADYTQRIKNQNNIRFIKINSEVRRSTFWEKIILNIEFYIETIMWFSSVQLQYRV